MGKGLDSAPYSAIYQLKTAREGVAQTVQSAAPVGWNAANWKRGGK